MIKYDICIGVRYLANTSAQFRSKFYDISRKNKLTLDTKLQNISNIGVRHVSNIRTQFTQFKPLHSLNFMVFRKKGAHISYKPSLAFHMEGKKKYHVFP